MDSSSGVKCPGTFSGLREKIPYLKDLGVNALEPVSYTHLFLDDLKMFCSEHISSVIIHGIYVNHTLLLFFKDFAASYQNWEHFICKRRYGRRTVSLETESVLYTSCLLYTSY